MSGQIKPPRPLMLVAAVLLYHPVEKNVFVAQRPPHKANANLWEFPGGKLEEGETPEQALARELEEELTISINPASLSPLSFSSHTYDQFHLLMPLYACHEWRGTISPTEHQATDWISPDHLEKIPLAPADIPLIPAVRKFIETLG